MMFMVHAAGLPCDVSDEAGAQSQDRIKLINYIKQALECGK